MRQNFFFRLFKFCALFDLNVKCDELFYLSVVIIFNCLFDLFDGLLFYLIVRNVLVN